MLVWEFDFNYILEQKVESTIKMLSGTHIPAFGIGYIMLKNIMQPYTC